MTHYIREVLTAEEWKRAGSARVADWATKFGIKGNQSPKMAATFFLCAFFGVDFNRNNQQQTSETTNAIGKKPSSASITGLRP